MEMKKTRLLYKDTVMSSVYCESMNMVTEARISAHTLKCQPLAKYTTDPLP